MLEIRKDKMTNKLASENSPYLLQHSENPVDWYPWGKEALEKAKLENKPIFLSIGYAACHWCHVMAHESFENQQTAVIMNEHFVNIKVDREERPDLDEIYMKAVVSIAGQGGWPMSVFLTPDGKPFFGGTYFPPERRFNIPSFREILLGVSKIWQNDREKIIESAEILLDQLRIEVTNKLPHYPLSRNLLDEAAFRLIQTYDWENGGWGKAPKFPQPMAIEYLLRLASRGDKLALEVAAHALQSMIKGGMYDVIGGGFARYSTDEKWFIPHFEKMLYDNALLARAYLHAYLITKNSYFKQICEETLDFALRELAIFPENQQESEIGFASSLDADSEGQEGKYYLWSIDEIRSVLSDLHIHELHTRGIDPAEFFIQAHGLTDKENFEGGNIIRRKIDYNSLSTAYNITCEAAERSMQKIIKKLQIERNKRIPPTRDDKVLCFWNSLLLSAFSEAAWYLRRQDYLRIAQKIANFIILRLSSNGRLFRSWRNGASTHTAYLEDYASFICGLLSLYQVDANPRWYSSAVSFTEEMIEKFKDPQGGFFDTDNDKQGLIIRPKNIQDNATPSGNSLAANALIQMKAFTGSDKYDGLAEEAMFSVSGWVSRSSLGFSNWLCAIDMALHPLREIAILGVSTEAQGQLLLDVLRDQYYPSCVIAYSQYPPPANVPPLLLNRPQLNNSPTAYVCHNLVCQMPVNHPNDLIRQLEQ